MVIARIIGGLGNQLFQYAAARRLANLHRTTLKLDITGFENYTWHAYSLRPFRIQEVFPTLEEIHRIKGALRKGLAKRSFHLSQRLKPYYHRPIFSEPSLGPFDANILKTPRDVYLDGYWQSEKYFIDIEHIIRREFTIGYEQDSQSRKIADMIVSSQSVSIHVRRGNFASNPQVNKVHGMCSLEYYQKCIRQIAERITFPHFFVFSDDPQWVQENLRIEHPATFISHNGSAKDYEDLRLMSMCQHQIIANSTFSWLAAWLNTNPNKIVFAPRRWFNDPNLDTRDLLPDNWIKV